MIHADLERMTMNCIKQKIQKASIKHILTMSSHTNPICARCAKAYEQLNGRYCTLIKRNVEYDKTPACQSQTNK